MNDKLAQLEEQSKRIAELMEAE